MKRLALLGLAAIAASALVGCSSSGSQSGARLYPVSSGGNEAAYNEGRSEMVAFLEESGCKICGKTHAPAPVREVVHYPPQDDYAPLAFGNFEPRMYYAPLVFGSCDPGAPGFVLVGQSGGGGGMMCPGD